MSDVVIDVSSITSIFYRKSAVSKDLADFRFIYLFKQHNIDILSYTPYNDNTLMVRV